VDRQAHRRRRTDAGDPWVVCWRIVDLCQWLFEEFRISVWEATKGRVGDARDRPGRAIAGRKRLDARGERGRLARLRFRPNRVASEFRCDQGIRHLSPPIGATADGEPLLGTEFVRQRVLEFQGDARVLTLFYLLRDVSQRINLLESFPKDYASALSCEATRRLSAQLFNLFRHPRRPRAPPVARKKSATYFINVCFNVRSSRITDLGRLFKKYYRAWVKMKAPRRIILSRCLYNQASYMHFRSLNAGDDLAGLFYALRIIQSNYKRLF
jgi:hypothetical protein